MVLNNKSFEKAKKLINEKNYDVECVDWHDVMPTPTDENNFIESNGWYEYSLWFLGIDHQGAEDQTEFELGRSIPQEKLKYNFQYGDFSKIYLCALKKALEDAKDLNYSDIVEASESLINMLNIKESLQN